MNVRSPLVSGNGDQISADGHAAIVRFDIRGDPDKAAGKIAPVLAAVDRTKAEHPGLFIGEFGVASAEKGIGDSIARDFERAGLLSVVVTIAILVIAFGALVAAGIPLLLALSGVLATLGLLAIPSHVWPVDDNTSAVVLLIGLAVGVDYSLFYVKREREERAAGRSEGAALAAAAATSGRAVLVSGLTVLVAMAGMLVTGDKTFGSYAMATMLVVAIAVLGSLTVLPALLSRLGDGVNRVRVPVLHGLQRPNGSRVWGWVLDRVLRPARALGRRLGGPPAGAGCTRAAHEDRRSGCRGVPEEPRAGQGLQPAPGCLPGRARSRRRRRQGALGRRPAGPGRDQQAAGARARERAVSPAGHGRGVRARSRGSSSRSPARAATRPRTPRSRNFGATSFRRRSARSIPPGGVTGDTAISKDFGDSMHRSAPLVFAFVLGFVFVLLLAAFRSIVIAVKAIVLNLLSVAAAFGVLVLVFQHDWAKGIIGFDYSGGVVAWLPVFLFVILFGLSMDYHVFILSRIREAYDRGMKTEDAVAHGIKTTAGFVTSAAFVMVFVFAIFGTLSLVMMKQFGVGLAAAVPIDATSFAVSCCPRR